MQSYPRDPRLQEILDRASPDPTFRQRLLTAPHDAVRDTFGIEIPRAFRIRFIEKDPADDALIVLPGARRPPRPPSDELDDAELEGVAGGWDGGREWTAPEPGDGGWTGDWNEEWTGWK